MTKHLPVFDYRPLAGEIVCLNGADQYERMEKFHADGLLADFTMILHPPKDAPKRQTVDLTAMRNAALELAMALNAYDDARIGQEKQRLEILDDQTLARINAEPEYRVQA